MSDAPERITALDARDARIRREERERCAKVAESQMYNTGRAHGPNGIAAALRAMGDE